ncbi:MAG: LysE family translocator [Bacteroidota bacterium]
MELITPVWKGIITGLLFTLTFGTVFFSLIQTSIKRGFKKAIFIAVGVLLSDAFFIAVALWGTSFIAAEMHRYDHEIRSVGFLFLMVLGIRSIIKKEKDHTHDAAPAEKHNLLYAIKGLMLNSINPMVLISWISLTTYVHSSNNFNFGQLLFYFAVVLTTMFATMFGIVYFADKLRNILSAKNLHRLNVFSGVVFIVFALIIIWPVTGLGAR